MVAISPLLKRQLLPQTLPNLNKEIVTKLLGIFIDGFQL